MKKFLTTSLILSSFLFLSFIPAHFDGDFDGDPIKYEVISSGNLNHINTSNTECFSLNDQFDYDNFWMDQHGDMSEKPTVNMDNSRLLVLLKAGTIDNITVSSESINIYLTLIRYYSYAKTDQIPPTVFRIIKIEYNGKPIRVFQQFVEPETQQQ